MSNSIANPISTEDQKVNTPSKTYDFVVLFDCKNGNPNGDPDLDNMPRRNIYTDEGLISDVCLKRKIRDYILLRHADEKGLGIFIQKNKNLEAAVNETAANDAEAVPSEDKPKGKSKGNGKGKSEMSKEEGLQRLQQLKEKFWDIRAFGGVITPLSKARIESSVTGPVVFQPSTSTDPIEVSRMTVTRVCQANEEKQTEKGENGTFGGKWYTPYAFYRCEGSISGILARNTGFSEQDAEILWDAIEHMFDHNISASRGLMTVRKLIIFEHSSVWGSQNRDNLFNSVKVERICKDDTAPLSYQSYKITSPKEDQFPGVKVTVKTFTNAG